MLSARNTQRPACSVCVTPSAFFHSAEESDVRFISSRLGSNLEDVAAPRNEQHLFTLCEAALSVLFVHVRIGGRCVFVGLLPL